MIKGQSTVYCPDVRSNKTIVINVSRQSAPSDGHPRGLLICPQLRQERRPPSERELKYLFEVQIAWASQLGGVLLTVASALRDSTVYGAWIHLQIARHRDAMCYFSARQVSTSNQYRKVRLGVVTRARGKLRLRNS